MGPMGTRSRAMSSKDGTAVEDEKAVKEENPEEQTTDTNMIDYLRPPRDFNKMMLTPPLSPIDAPLPPAWSLDNPEAAPVPEDLTEFDLAAPAGMVSTGEGRYVPIAETTELLGLEGEAYGYSVVRRKILSFQPQEPVVIIDYYTDK